MTSPDPIIITSHLLDDFARCPRLFRYNYLAGYSETSTNVNLHFGLAVANGVHLLRRTNNVDIATAGAYAYFKRENFANYSGPKTAEKLLDIFVSYKATFDTAVEEPLFHEERLYEVLPYTINDAAVLYSGKPDSAFSVGGKFNVVVDEKTTTRATDDYAFEWLHSRQMRGYAWLYAANGINIDAVEIRQLVIHKNDFHWRSTRPMLIPPHYIDEFLIDLDIHIQRMKELWETRDGDNLGYFPKLGFPCMTRYGKCDYATTCHTGV